jgi:hypothetical protein
MKLTGVWTATIALIFGFVYIATAQNFPFPDPCNDDGIQCVMVINNVGVAVTIHFDGDSRGTVAPGQHPSYPISQGKHVLSATAPGLNPKTRTLIVERNGLYYWTLTRTE